MPPTQILKSIFGRDAAHLTAIDFGHATFDLLGPCLIVSEVKTALSEDAHASISLAVTGS